MMFDLRLTGSGCRGGAVEGSEDGGGALYCSWLAGGALIGARGRAGEGLDLISRLPLVLSPRRLRTA